MMTKMRAAIISTDNVASRGDAPDRAGEKVRSFLRDEGMLVVSYAVLVCDRRVVKSELCRLTDHYPIDLIVTVGGTGLGDLDITPDATHDVMEMEVPGIAEAIRALLIPTWPESILSRVTAGVRQETLMVNLWGEAAAVESQLDLIWDTLPQAVGALKGRRWLRG